MCNYLLSVSGGKILICSLEFIYRYLKISSHTSVLTSGQVYSSLNIQQQPIVGDILSAK